MFLNPFKCQEIAVQSEGDSMCVPRLPYHFSIPITGNFAFGHSAETCFHVVYI